MGEAVATPDGAPGAFDSTGRAMNPYLSSSRIVSGLKKTKRNPEPVDPAAGRSIVKQEKGI
jgi:hypothetical protein